jgi:HAE1 family hydrophobic/amphiphilic exporter-1
LLRSAIDFSVKRPVTVSMLTLAVVLFGLVAFDRLPINLLPELSYPSLTVETRFPGAAPAEVETLVTRRVEEAVGILAGVRRMSSRSRPGLSQVTLEFEWGREMALASLDVRQKLDVITLPRETEKPVILRFDPSTDPIQRLYLTDTAAEGAAAAPGTPEAKRAEAALFRLRYVAEEILKKDLESIDGVAAVKVNGGLEEEIQVRLDEGQLALLGLTAQQVKDVLARENVNLAGGSLYEQEARYLVRANNEFLALGDIEATIVTERDGRPVRLRDVAIVERTHKRREVVTRFAGREAVELDLYKEGDANTVNVARATRARMEALKKELPEGVALGYGTDQSRFIESAIDGVMGNAIAGGALAMIILLLFLKDLRSTLIVGLCIPVSIVATFFMMYRMGVTLNVISLGGLALGVGNLVDNAIVVLEAIVARRERGESLVPSVLRGAGEVAGAVVASTLTTVAVFLPVVFVEGFAAQLFRDQALTVSFSQVASLAVALTLIPMVSARGARRPLAADASPAAAPLSRLARARRAVLVAAPGFLLRIGRRAVAALFGLATRLAAPVARAFDALLGRVLVGYPRLLAAALDRPRRVVAVSAVLFALAVLGATRLDVDLIPSFAQGEFRYLVELPEGTPLHQTDRALLPAQQALAGDAAIESYAMLAGGAASLSSTGTEGENAGRLEVRMKPGAGSEAEEGVLARLREELGRIPGARVTFERPSSFSFRTPIEVEVYGEDLEAVRVAAANLRERLSALPGLVDVRSSAELGSPELHVRFDRDALARLGLDLAQVASVVRQKVRGEVATRMTQGDREIDVLVRASERQEVTADEVARVIVAQRQGTPVYLASVATVERAVGPAEIRRISQRRAAVVSANLSGRSLGAAAADVRRVLREAPLPPSVIASLSGQEEERERSFASLMLALGLALFLVYLVMAAQFESLLHPFVVFGSVPLAAVGVVATLLLLQQTVTVVVMIGVVVLGGIVVNNAIVLIDAVKQLREEGHPVREALMLAGQRRLRPILMTTATTVLGLIPMALGLGEGAELQAPLAITVIAGLSFSTLLTLVVIPSAYLLLDRTPAAEGLAQPAETGPGGAGPDDAGAAAGSAREVLA